MRILSVILTAVFAAGAAAAAEKAVQFVVLVPDATADQTPRVFMASSVDGWSEPGRPLERVAPGIYCATFALEAGTALEYKFTRAGSWATVEKAARGREIANRTLIVDKTLTEQVVVHQVECWADRPAAKGRRVDIASIPDAAPPTTTRASTLTGDIRFHDAFRSPQLKNDRRIMVYLPPGYDANPAARYPVLYMHDGNNLFDAATSFLGVEWQVDETAERLIKAGQIRKLIIVGIYNNADRMSEYTPFREGQHGGNGDAYLAFIVDTLKPFIDETYRTRPGRTDTAIGGSSLGGLISLYAAYKYPEVFGSAAVISPTLQWADGAILPYVREHKPAALPKLWIDMGTAEGDTRDTDGVTRPVKDCRGLVKILTAAGNRPEADFHYDEVEGGRHNEADWARRFERVLVFLFGAAPR